MYWPLGAPQVYAATTSRRKLPKSSSSDDSEVAEDKGATVLLGLRVSRSGRLFATITAKTLTVWQTSVSRERYGID